MQHRNMHGIENKRVQNVLAAKLFKKLGKDDVRNDLVVCQGCRVLLLQIKRCTCEDTHAH